jgi:hypothetical protein
VDWSVLVTIAKHIALFLLILALVIFSSGVRWMFTTVGFPLNRGDFIVDDAGNFRPHVLRNVILVSASMWLVICIYEIIEKKPLWP